MIYIVQYKQYAHWFSSMMRPTTIDSARQAMDLLSKLSQTWNDPPSKFRIIELDDEIAGSSKYGPARIVEKMSAQQGVSQNQTAKSYLESIHESMSKIQTLVRQLETHTNTQLVTWADVGELSELDSKLAQIALEI